MRLSHCDFLPLSRVLQVGKMMASVSVARSEERPGFHSWTKGGAFPSRVEGIVFIYVFAARVTSETGAGLHFFVCRVDSSFFHIFPRSAKSFLGQTPVKAQRSDVVLWLDYIHHGGEAQHNHLHSRRSSAAVHRYTQSPDSMRFPTLGDLWISECAPGH